MSEECPLRYKAHVNSNTDRDKTQFDINQTKFLALSEVLNARVAIITHRPCFIRQKAEFAPEAESKTEMAEAELHRAQAISRTFQQRR